MIIKLLLAIMGGQQSNFKLWIQVGISNNLPPMICCECIVKML